MYRIDGAIRADPARRWALPDRVFFACGACHILAHAFLQRAERSAARPLWLKPTAGFTGNHIIVECGDRVFDYHGYSDRERSSFATLSARRGGGGLDGRPN